MCCCARISKWRHRQSLTNYIVQRLSICPTTIVPRWLIYKAVCVWDFSLFDTFHVLCIVLEHFLHCFAFWPFLKNVKTGHGRSVPLCWNVFASFKKSFASRNNDHTWSWRVQTQWVFTCRKYKYKYNWKLQMKNANTSTNMYNGKIQIRIQTQWVFTVVAFPRPANDGLVWSPYKYKSQVQRKIQRQIQIQIQIWLVFTVVDFPSSEHDGL